jgi:RimJ/RimL family protein N-acetyltransferase
VDDLWRNPITLTGKTVWLEPLSISRVHDLVTAGRDKSIWQYMLYGEPVTEEGMRNWVIDILHRRDADGEIPFAVVHHASGKAIGSTRFMEMRPEHKALEIGGTWYAVEYQHTQVNTECKILLLEYAFETLDCIRVQFKTDLRNIRSQRAIESLGAVKEGIFRNHLITPEGAVRDSVYYSILKSEWSTIKTSLEMKLSNFA